LNFGHDGTFVERSESFIAKNELLFEGSAEVEQEFVAAALITH
jgi:hypothetical protein